MHAVDCCQLSTAGNSRQHGAATSVDHVRCSAFHAFGCVADWRRPAPVSGEQWHRGSRAAPLGMHGLAIVCGVAVHSYAPARSNALCTTSRAKHQTAAASGYMETDSSHAQHRCHDCRHLDPASNNKQLHILSGGALYPILASIQYLDPTTQDIL